MGDTCISSLKNPRQSKFGLATVVLMLLLVQASQQVSAFNFTASQVTPTGTNSSTNYTTLYQISTNLISWDNGATFKPIYVAQLSGTILNIYNENNNGFVSQSLTGSSIHHVLDPDLKLVLLDRQGGDTGPALYTLTYDPATGTGSVTKKLTYSVTGFNQFIGGPTRNPNTTYYYGLYNTGSQTVMAQMDGSSSLNTFVKTQTYTNTSQENYYLILTTSSAQPCNLLLGWVAIFGQSTTTIKATYYIKPDFSISGSTISVTAPGSSQLKIPSSNWALLDNFDETRLFYIDVYSKNVFLYSDVFNTTVTTLTKAFTTTTPLSAGFNEVYSPVNLGAHNMVAVIIESATIAWKAMIYSKADMSTIATGLSIQSDLHSPPASVGMVFLGFYQNGGDAVLPIGAIASTPAGMQHIIGNITFKMCTGGT